jgi:hypothetical protein
MNGKVVARGVAPGGRVRTHSQGFELALTHALRQPSVRPYMKKELRVVYSVQIGNPGGVGEYMVQLVVP